MDELLPVERLHRAVDAATAPLVRRHGARLACKRGCTACCVDDISVFEVEAALIRRHHGPLLAESRPHPEGACAFLAEDGACRIYATRPYVCRTQGLPMRWHEERGDETVEVRDICPLNEAGEPLVALDVTECWTLGAAERHLAALAGESPNRVRLRDLFVTR